MEHISPPDSHPDQEAGPTTWVHLIEMDGTTLQGKTILTCMLTTNGTITFHGDPQMMQQLNEGIRDEAGTLLLPKAGLAFLQALSIHFRTPYFFATTPQTGDAITPYTQPVLKKPTAQME